MPLMSEMLGVGPYKLEDEPFAHALDPLQKYSTADQTDDRFADLFLGLSGTLEPPETGWGTTVAPTLTQDLIDLQMRERQRNMEMTMLWEGHYGDWKEFEKKRGQSGIMGTVNYLMQDIISPAFDLLSIGNYTTAGFILEWLRTGSAQDAFHQAAREFVTALPGLEVEGARRTRFGDVLREYGEQKGGLFSEDHSRWWAASIGFFLDITLDPVNYFPGMTMAKAIKYAGHKARTGSGPLGRAFDFLFTPERRLQRVGEQFAGIPEDVLKSMGLTREQLRNAPPGTLAHSEEVGKRLFEGWKRTEGRIAHRSFREGRELDMLYASLKPEERVLLTMGLEDPKKLLGELTSISQQAPGLMPETRVKELMDVADNMKTHFKSLLHRDTLTGHLDPSVSLEHYIHGVRAQTRTLRESIKQYQEAARKTQDITPAHRWGRISGRRKGGERLVAGADEPFSPGLRGETRVNRLEEILQERALMEPGRHTMEFDPVIAMKARTYETIRREETLQFHKKVLSALTTPGADGRPAGVAVSLDGVPEVALQGKESFLNWAHATFDLNKMPGYEFLAMTRKRVIPIADKAKRIKGHPTMTVDEVVAAYLLPNPVVEFMNRSHDVMSSVGDMNTFLKTFDNLTNIWKGWAVMSPGFHMRNYSTGVMFNWMEGLGSKDLLANNPHISLQVPTGRFIQRTLQGIQMQMLADGANAAPSWTVRTLNKLTDTFTPYKSFADIPIKPLKVKGEMWDVKRILREAENYNIPQAATKYSAEAFDVVGGHGVWTGVSGDVAETINLLPGVSKATKTAMSVARTPKRTVLGEARHVLGSENPAFKANLALGQIMDNSNRYALWYDLLSKGMDPEVAARRIHTVHFDYSLLTDVEKTIFRRIMPFYAWARYSTPRMLMAMVENPGRLSKIPKFRDALKDLTIDFGDIPTPDYFERRQAFQLPMMLQDMPLYAEVDLPMLELNQWNIDNIASSLHPLAVGFFEAVPDAGYSFFLRREKETYPGQPSAQFPFLTGRDAGLVQALVPPAARLGRGYAAIAEQLRTGAPEATAWAMSEATGVKFRPIDTRRVLRGNRIRQNKLMRDYYRYLHGEERRLERELRGEHRREGL